MASAFDLIAEITLESRAMERSLQSVATKLDATDKSLDGVIAKSNRLGDTSATTARRIEKLNEGITAQRNRLLDNALAFEKGEISVQKFSGIVTSVDKNIVGLNSRIKDAKARLSELNETGLTHFQQQITTAVDAANNKLESFRQNILAQQGAVSNPQSTSFFKNLMGRLDAQQKLNLSFQANDVISGLAMGQNPLQILAQQGGQIVQIFQQGKVAQEGVATATTAAATAQAAFATSATTSAVSQAAVATSSAATAASMQAAAGSATILGASVGTLAGLLSAGAIAIFAVYKVTQQIEAVAKQRLALEEKITGEWGKQNILAGELLKKRAEAAEQRNFDKFLGEGSPEALQKRTAELEQQERAAVAEAAEFRRRQQAVGDTDTRLRDTSRGGIPVFGKIIPGDSAKKLVDDLAKQAEAAEAKARTLHDRILELDKGVLDSKQRRADADVEITRFAERTKFEVQSEANKAAFEAQKEHTKKILDDAKQKAKEWAEHVKKARVEIRNIFESTSDNPFVRIFSDGEQAVLKMLEATKGLGSELQNTLKKLIDGQTQTKAFKQSMENSLQAAGLRSEAAQFLGKAKPTISESLQSQLNAIGGGSPFAAAQDFQMVNGKWQEMARRADPNQRARDQKIIELTKGMADAELTPAQKQQAAAARLREAAALDAEKPDAIKIQKDTLQALTKLNGAIDQGSIVRIINEAPDNAKVSSRPRRADSNAYFGK